MDARVINEIKPVWKVTHTSMPRSHEHVSGGVGGPQQLHALQAAALKLHVYPPHLLRSESRVSDCCQRADTGQQDCSSTR